MYGRVILNVGEIYRTCLSLQSRNFHKISQVSLSGIRVGKKENPKKIHVRTAETPMLMVDDKRVQTICFSSPLVSTEF